jgi:DNA mismatch repair protein MutL
MLAKIIQLDKHVAELIAAGEVVERPASVVKELVENCIDAGASTVTVEIKRGGLELIRVSDNGSGIGADDIRAAFLRHATSKIRTADDLNSIMTMGFRGEALASIASVSKVTVFTRTPEATAGLCYEIEGGQEKSLEEAGCPAGTTILVKELFYNTPARMKFIKKDIAEAGQVQTVVRRAALARPDISFKLIKDGEELLHTPGDHSLISAVYCVYGGPFAAGFEKTGTEHEGVRVSGYVSKPVFSQGNRTKQEFFVNARPVRSRILSAALEEAYKNRMMANRYPACVLHSFFNDALRFYRRKF